jgi:molybdopterin converting factor small subunit
LKITENLPGGRVVWFIIRTDFMLVTIRFYSRLKDLAGCAETRETLPPGSTLADLLQALGARFPGLRSAEKSILLAVGLDYQDRGYTLRDGDEVALLPPVQGG